MEAIIGWPTDDSGPVVGSSTPIVNTPSLGHGATVVVVVVSEVAASGWPLVSSPEEHAIIANDDAAISAPATAALERCAARIPSR
jgi:hypothetical protein